MMQHSLAIAKPLRNLRLADFVGVRLLHNPSLYEIMRPNQTDDEANAK
jgi:hypothetical protein